MHREFKYKLDFYYQQTLIYLATLFLYAGIRGTIVEGQFTFVYHDPLVYIIIFFFIVSLIGLILNRLRNRRLIVADDAIIFRSRDRDRRIPVNEIEWMHIGRERFVQTAGRFQLILIKVRDRKRVYRIRAGRYERDHELVSEMERIAADVPRPGRREFGMRRRKPR
jgi:hypothetical protein